MTTPVLVAAILAAALSSAVPMGVAAQTGPRSAGTEPVWDGFPLEQVPALTLAEALEIAAGSNPVYRRELNTLGLSGASRQQAIGRFLPSVSVSAATRQGFDRQTVGTDDFGRPIPNPDTRTTYTSLSSQALNLTWTLFDGFQRFRELEEQEARVEVWTGAANARLAALTAEVESAFFEAQLRRELVAVEEEVLRVRRRILEATERMFALAARTRTDVLGARVEVQSQERALQSARSAYRRQILILRRVLGDPTLAEFDVADAPLDVFEPATLDVDDLLARAHVANPEIRRDEADVALNRAAASRQRGTRWPSLELGGSLGRVEWGRDQTALFDLSPSAQSNGALSLSLRWDVFDRFGRQYDIAQADVAHRNAMESLRETRLRVEEDVRRGYIELETAHVNLESALGAEALAQERLRLVGEEYLLAATDFLELQDVVQQAADQARAVVEARFQFVDARIDLERAIGARITTDPPR